MSSSLVRQFFEKLSKGECEEIISMVNNFGLDVSSVRNDAANFLQTPLFEACAIKDEDKALRLVQFLLDQGVSPHVHDELN